MPGRRLEKTARLWHNRSPCSPPCSGADLQDVIMALQPASRHDVAGYMRGGRGAVPQHGRHRAARDAARRAASPAVVLFVHGITADRDEDEFYTRGHKFLTSFNAVKYCMQGLAFSILGQRTARIYASGQNIMSATIPPVLQLLKLRVPHHVRIATFPSYPLTFV